MLGERRTWLVANNPTGEAPLELLQIIKSLVFGKFFSLKSFFLFLEIIFVHNVIFRRK
jgi:hypothetical protein